MKLNKIKDILSPKKIIIWLETQNMALYLECEETFTAAIREVKEETKVSISVQLCIPMCCRIPVLEAMIIQVLFKKQNCMPYPIQWISVFDDPSSFLDLRICFPMFDNVDWIWMLYFHGQLQMKVLLWIHFSLFVFSSSFLQFNWTLFLVANSIFLLEEYHGKERTIFYGPHWYFKKERKLEPHSIQLSQPTILTSDCNICDIWSYHQSY